LLSFRNDVKNSNQDVVTVVWISEAAATDLVHEFQSFILV